MHTGNRQKHSIWISLTIFKNESSINDKQTTQYILKIYITHIYNRNVAIKIEIYRQLTKVFARSRHFLNAFFAHCTIRVVFLCISTNQPITLDIFRKSRSLTVTKYYLFCLICVITSVEEREGNVGSKINWAQSGL